MIQSMTGFGSAEREGYKVEIRSLNHRYLDINVRIPLTLSAHEMYLRSRAKERIARGKVDITVVCASSAAQGVGINMEAAEGIHSMLKKLSNTLSLASDKIDLNHMLYFKDYIVTPEEIRDETPLLGAFEAALDVLCQMREREGEALAAELATMADRIAELNEKVMAGAPKAIEARRNGFISRLKEVLSADMIDEQRAFVEASTFAERADITEEITRIRHHASHMREILAGGGTIGRKLDFLFQELNREANTIGSKTDDPGLIDYVIEMKAEIERAREQVQNIQ